MFEEHFTSDRDTLAVVIRPAFSAAENQMAVGISGGGDGGGAAVVNVSAAFNISAGGWQRVTAPPTAFGSAASPVALWNTQPAPPLCPFSASLT